MKEVWGRKTRIAADVVLKSPDLVDPHVESRLRRVIGYDLLRACCISLEWALAHGVAMP